MKNKSLKLIIFLLSISLLSFLLHYMERTKTIESLVKQQNFITVQPWYIYPDKISFDLEKKNLFSDDLAEAVRNGKSYEGYRHVKNNGNIKFEKNKAYTLYYPLIANDVTKVRVRHKHFKIRQEVPKKYHEVIKSLTKRFSTTEMVVIYNKDYLPIEIQLYDTVDKKWTMFARYSYPYKNRKEYEKELNECIEAVLNGDFGED
ncbi:hypothetical protein R7892_09810 [Ligilactobacillus murinus]|uniref:DUF4094 domain-containing protein n=1 Tax=Ligilactobacillus murinus TaxID=1622 RepID=UPI00296A966D|nr:hypothetical protein [Ligilactobacillus murinus]WOY88962.1 hypothetical protein R7892_09810 [Ligilactobacillus murinus]